MVSKMNFDPQSILNKTGGEKLYRIPAVYYSSWLEKHQGSLRGKRVLDFGCGEGVATVGLSLFCDVASVVGVDIGDDFLECDASLKSIDSRLSVPENVEFLKIPPASYLGSNEFDVIVSWSVMEHISQEIFDRQMQLLYAALKPSGYCIFQIAPLYYSPYGSHLFGLHEPWAHLYKQHSVLHTETKTQVRDEYMHRSVWDCFVTLNKFTGSEFLRRFTASGLAILDVYETFVNDPPSSALSEVFCTDVLTKEQILVVCKKVGGAE